MATEALFPRKSIFTRPVYRPVNRSTERIFFGGMSILLCIVVVFGFAKTYFFAGMVRAPLPSPILHIHGAVFTLWMVLLLIQSAFISAHRVAWHRTVGTIAFCLPPIMIVLGTIAGIDALARGVMIGPLDPATSLSIPLLGIGAFAILIFAAWRTRRRPDAHKRLIIFATIELAGAAFGRLQWEKIGVPPSAPGPVIGIGLMLLLVIGYDLFTLHRLHRSTMWAAPLTFAAEAFAVPIGMTGWWHSFAGFVLRNVAPHV
jgi:hypothetical protein